MLVRAVRLFLASALTPTPVEPPLASLRGKARLKVVTHPGAAKFQSEGDHEWKVVERPGATPVVENVLSLAHELTGFRRLEAEGEVGAKKWLTAVLLADSDSREVKAFTAAACAEAKVTTRWRSAPPSNG